MATMPKFGTVTAADPAKQPKNTWETVFTLTPVILTLLATVLAGLSSSEMIQAQYYRSMAAQNQSKAGDQWGFFQAKRIRSTIAERLLDQKPGIPGPIEIDEFRAGAQRLADRFEALGGAGSSFESRCAGGRSARPSVGKAAPLCERERGRSEERGERPGQRAGPSRN